MKKVTLAILSLALVCGAQTIHITGTVKSAAGVALQNAVVVLQSPTQDLPMLRTLSDATGAFALDSSAGGTGILAQGRSISPFGALAWSQPMAGEVTITVDNLQGQRMSQRAVALDAGNHHITNAQGLLADLSAGVYVIQVKQQGRALARSVLVRSEGSRGEARIENLSAAPALALAKSVGGFAVEIRLAGYVPYVQSLTSTIINLGTITLTRDPIETKIDSIMNLLTLAEKIGQMTQADIINISTSSVNTYKLGSILSGGDEAIPDYDSYQNVATTMTHPIPILYGVDAVHGNNKVSGAVVFPHNIGLGATRDTNLVRRIGEVTAKEVLASGVDWTYAPCIAVVRDERWGRTYESFGETPELAVQLGASMIRGLQGNRFDAPWRVVATAKHFLADGGTKYGTSSAGWAGSYGLLDQGNAVITDSVVRAIHLPGYQAAVDANVLSVMASYSSINGVKMHGNKTWLTDVLKTELGFEGFVISDYNAIIQINSTYSTAVKTAINAGVDVAMEAGGTGYYNHADFISTLTTLVNNGSVTQARIDDAVRRILRVKYRVGRFDSPLENQSYDAEFGGAEHRAIAREAVRKSVVVLKNDASTLPLAKNGKKIAVFGSHSNNAGLQCGGWTLSWQGLAGTVSGATTILQGLQSAVGTSTVTSVSQYSLPSDADEFVVVVGDGPYAEFLGDSADVTMPDGAQSAVTAAIATGKPVILVLVSGRPLIIPQTILDGTKAIVATWWPGTEGAGVADILFGDYAPTGKLPITWPKTMAQVTLHVGDAGYADTNAPLYPYGYGLTW